MKVTETFRISFKALGDRKVRTSLTILMVIVGSSLMVTLNGIVGRDWPEWNRCFQQ